MLNKSSTKFKIILEEEIINEEKIAILLLGAMVLSKAPIVAFAATDSVDHQSTLSSTRNLLYGDFLFKISENINLSDKIVFKKGALANLTNQFYVFSNDEEGSNNEGGNSEEKFGKQILTEKQLDAYKELLDSIK